MLELHKIQDMLKDRRLTVVAEPMRAILSDRQTRRRWWENVTLATLTACQITWREGMSDAASFARRYTSELDGSWWPCRPGQKGRHLAGSSRSAPILDPEKAEAYFTANPHWPA